MDKTLLRVPLVVHSIGHSSCYGLRDMVVLVDHMEDRVSSCRLASLTISREECDRRIRSFFTAKMNQHVKVVSDTLVSQILTLPT